MPKNNSIIAMAMLSLTFVCNGLFAQGYLRVQGKAIVNETGDTVILRGMGLGGWMLQEGYMFNLSFLGQQYKIKEKIIESIGNEKAEWFYEEWLKRHTTKKDINLLASYGFNSIRLPMHFALYTLPVVKEPVQGQQTWIEKGFALTDSLLQWCKLNKMYLILDLHAAPGGQGNDLAISDRDPSKPSLWESEANKEKTIALWKKLAERYANEPWIGGYDIINEPNWGFTDSSDTRGTKEEKNIPLKQFMQDITKAIRNVDKKHIIIIEGNGFGNNYKGILPAWDNNMVVSFHKYGNYNTASSIKQFIALRDQHNIPLWLGESGENSNTWFMEAIQLVENEGIGWAWWQHKKMGINNPLEIKKPAGYNALLDGWNGKAPLLSADSSLRVLKELLNNVEAKNNIYHPDVTDAMFRQIKHTSAIPFRNQVLKDTLTVLAIHFDMGGQRIGYYDTDSASYHYTPGVNTTGNRGRAFRNDGVDIYTGEKAFYVGSTEDGEWMQYTIEVQKAGKYKLGLTSHAKDKPGKASVLQDAKQWIHKIEIPLSNGWQTYWTEEVELRAGTHAIRIFIENGGFDILDFKLIKS